MTFDLIVRGGALPDGRVVDVGIAGDRIAAIEPALGAEAKEVLDASGQLLSAPFVDAHFHMDATLSYGLPRVNASGTLLEGIALWGELKPTLTQAALEQRALAYVDWAVSLGLLATRSHVDVCDDRLLGAEALLSVKRRVAPYFDLQLVAFPQDGYFRSPGAPENLKRALDLGLDVVGGIPHHERTAEDGRLSLKNLCELAADRGLPVDIHCDETDDPNSRHIEALVYETQRLGLQGRVTGSHLCSMHSMANNYAAKIIALMAEADVAAIANPLINITLQGRYDSYPKRRGMTRVPELLAAGVRVAFGQDCTLDPWYALGTADMLDVAFMGVHVAQMTSQPELAAALGMVTAAPAAILGLDFGLEVGKLASLVVLQADDPIDALRSRANRLAVVSKGKIVATTPPRASALRLPGRPQVTERRFRSLAPRRESQS